MQTAGRKEHTRLEVVVRRAGVALESRLTTVTPVNEADIVDFIVVVLGNQDTYSLHVWLDTGLEELKNCIYHR